MLKCFSHCSVKKSADFLRGMASEKGTCALCENMCSPDCQKIVKKEKNRKKRRRLFL